jgi:hypothetical protein
VPMLIRLETERRNTLRELCDSNDVISRLVTSCLGELPPLHLARYIMPFDRTVFNTLQAACLLPDVERLIVKGSGTDDLGVLRPLRSLVLECQHNMHSYVTFNGRHERA